MENASNDSQGPLAQEGAGSGSRSVKTALGCLLCLLVLSTLVGNALVCLAIIRFHHLRTKVTNWFVLSLAASDLCVGLLVMPWRAVTEVMGGIWPFGRSFCDTWVAFDITCSTASILHLCIISLDRYWAIASPFRYERRMTQCLAATMISLAWVLSLLISFIPVQLHWHKADQEEIGGPLLQRCNTRLNRTYAIASSLISFYIPVSIMIGTYTRIYRIAQAQIRRISSLERAGGLLCAQGKEPTLPLKNSLSKETKVLQTLSIIMGVFVCCWLPFFLLNCLLPFCELRTGGGIAEPVACVDQTTLSIFTWLGWANSSLNPVIYAFNADFRRAFSRLLGCHGLCCWTTSASTSTIERVNLSNELVSYQQDSSCHKGRSSQPASLLLPTITAWSQAGSHPVNIQGEEKTDEGTQQEKGVPQSSRAALDCSMSNRDLSILLPSECEAEVIFERCTPFVVIARY